MKRHSCESFVPMLGAGWHHIDVKDGMRQGVLASYLEPSLGRSNLITPGSSSGVNWYAVPRQAECGVKLSF